MTSTIPAGIHCPGSIRKTISWDPDEKERMRRGEAKTLHLTTPLAQLDPRQHPAPSIRYSQSSSQKGRGAERASASHSMLLVIQATAAHGVTIPRAVSWEALCLILTKSSGCKPAHAIWTANCPWLGQCPEGAQEPEKAIGSFVHNNNPGKRQGQSLFSKSCPHQRVARTGLLLWVTQSPTPLSPNKWGHRGQSL